MARGRGEHHDSHGHQHDRLCPRRRALRHCRLAGPVQLGVGSQKRQRQGPRYSRPCAGRVSTPSNWPCGRRRVRFFSRGSLTVGLQVTSDASGVAPKLNEALLDAAIALAMKKAAALPPRALGHHSRAGESGRPCGPARRVRQHRRGDPRCRCSRGARQEAPDRCGRRA